MAQPSPATHSIVTELKAGERMLQAHFLTKHCFLHLEEHSHCFMHFLASKHSLGHFGTPSAMNLGYGARFKDANCVETLHGTYLAAPLDPQEGTVSESGLVRCAQGRGCAWSGRFFHTGLETAYLLPNCNRSHGIICLHILRSHPIVKVYKQWKSIPKHSEHLKAPKR